mgnify:CR=1 FL=1
MRLRDRLREALFRAALEAAREELRGRRVADPYRVAGEAARVALRGTSRLRASRLRAEWPERVHQARVIARRLVREAAHRLGC